MTLVFFVSLWTNVFNHISKLCSICDLRRCNDNTLTILKNSSKLFCNCQHLPFKIGPIIYTLTRYGQISILIDRFSILDVYSKSIRSQFYFNLSKACMYACAIRYARPETRDENGCRHTINVAVASDVPIHF